MNPSKALINQPRIIHGILHSNLFPVLLLKLPQIITQLVYEQELKELNVLSTLKDRYHDLFLHTLNLLRGSEEYQTTLLALLPSPMILLTQQKLDVYYFFAIVRSILTPATLQQMFNETPTSAWNLFTPTNEAILKQYYPPSLWETLDFRGYLLFWLMSYRDLSSVSGCYAEYARLIQKELEQKQKQKQQKNSHSERILTRLINEYKKEIGKIQEEQQQGEKRVQELDTLLLNMIPSLFHTTVDEGITAFIQHCLVPRVVMSPEDALFCYQFVRVIVENETPNYNHVLFVQRVLFILLSLVRGVTEFEAMNISIFLVELFTDLNRWNSNADEYAKFCEKNSCFKSDKQGDDVPLSYEKFKKVFSVLSLILFIEIQSLDEIYYCHRKFRFAVF